MGYARVSTEDQNLDLQRDALTRSWCATIYEETALGKLQFYVFTARAEFERNLIREQTLAGLTAARARGRVGGRKLKLSEKQSRENKTLLSDPATQRPSDPAAQVKDITERRRFCGQRFTNVWVSCSR